MKHIVIGDVHGNESRFTELMELLDVPYSVAEREQQGIEVIQLGDFLNLGYGQEELIFYDSCRGYVDVMLTGNHELPAIAPRPQYVRFVGYEERDIKAEARWVDDHAYGLVGQAAHSVGDWLITHAGLDMRHEDLIDFDAPAKEIATELNHNFNKFIHEEQIDGYTVPLFEDQSSIFWSRTVKNQHLAELHPLKEIIGHTPQVSNNTPQSFVSDDLFIIDIGAKVSLDNGIAALVTEDDGATWQLHEVAGTYERVEA